jgi:hypothetical protein
VRKIAVERDTTLTLDGEESSAERKERLIEALEGSFEKLQVRLGKTWVRADLYERS